jgi:UPF0176 protein
MPLLHIAGYKFTPLVNLNTIQAQLNAKASQLALKGTILLSNEGININLAGMETAIQEWQTWLAQQSVFNGIPFHITKPQALPYKRLKIKIKPEIITLRQPQINMTEKRAPAISPQKLKTWLDEQKDFTLLDTRNTYEIQYGSFERATHLNLQDFCEFPEKIEKIPTTKPVVMFCTGGIRCEKAALLMLELGDLEVYQLDGGILGYFAEVGVDHYQGHCYVFDERLALDSTLAPVPVTACVVCQAPIKPSAQILNIQPPTKIRCQKCLD